MDSTQTFIDYLGDQRLIVDYVYISAYAFLYYDWILTFHRELRLIWLQRWSFTKVLFLLARYTPMANGYCWLHCQLALNVDTGTCRPTYEAGIWLVLFGLTIAEIIYAMRTWAVWNRSKFVGIPLTILLCTKIIVCAISGQQYLDTIEIKPLPFPDFRGCIIIQGVQVVLFVNFILVIIIDIAVLSLMFMSAFGLYREGRSGDLSQVVHRDGIQFYFYLIPIAIVNIIVMKMSRPDIVTMMIPFQSNIYSILACRIILNIRDAVGKNNCQLTDYSYANEVVMMTPLFNTTSSDGSLEP